MANGQPRAGDLGQAARAPQRAPSPATAGTGRAPRPAGSADPGLTARLALAAVLLAVTFAGIRAAIAPTAWDAGPWHSRGVPLGIGLELVFGALLAAVELRRRRSPTTSQPAAGLRTLLRALLVTGVIAIPVLILINSAGKLRPARQHPFSPPQRLGLPSERPHPLSAHSAGSGAGPVLYALLAAVLLAAVVVCVILLRRRTRSSAWDDLGEVAGDEPQEQLRRAVQSGQAALREIDDARLAIIACYLAMERSLARAGAVRDAAETPDELLGRAASAGLVHGGEAAELTALFYEARFSSHPLPPGKRRQAQRALEILAASLATQASTAQASTGQASTGQADGPDGGGAP